MKVSHLKFTHKFILLISCLVILVSVFLGVTTIYLSHDGKTKVQKGVAEKLEVLRKESMEEFGKFAEVAEDGIEQASGVASIGKIMSIATENQERFMEVVNESIEKAGDEVATAVESENTIFREGLEELLIDSTDSMNEIMEFDTESMSVLTNVATFNMDSLSTSSLENLKRFTLLIENFEKKFEEYQELQNEEFDDFLIQLINMLEGSGQENEALITFLLEAFEEVKETSRERQEVLYKRLYDEFELQSKLVAEELKLVNRKVRYAINLELSHTTAIQEEKIDAVLNNLLEHQITLQEKIDKTNETLTQAVSELRTNLPLKLKEEGETVRKKIEEQSREAGKNAENAKGEVSLRIKNSINDTAAAFETGITGTKDIINQTLDTSSNRTLTLSLGIAVLCVLLSVVLGSLITRAIAKPLNRVVSLVKKVSDGDFSETLAANDVALDVNRKDEIGILASAVIEMKRVLSDVLKEIVVITDSIQEGKLDSRGNVEAFAGDWRDLVVELNGVIDAFVAPINVTAEYLDRLAKGDIPEEITEEYKGDFNEIKNNLNQCINAVSGLVDETVRLTGDAVDGRLDTRGNPDMFQGDFAKIVYGINATLDAVVSPLNVAAEYVERIARGDIPEKITDKYRGDFNEIRNNLNSLIDGLQELTQAAYAISGGDMSIQVNKRSEDDILAIAFQHMVETIRQVIGEIDGLVRSTMEGRLDIRGDHSKFRGDYVSIVKGVNDTLDAVIGPLTVAAEYVDRISEGDIPDVITDEYRGDFNDIRHNLNTLINSTNDVITLAQEIAGGNLNVTVELRSEQDELMIALQKMVRYLQEVADVTEKISNEDLQVDVNPKSEHDVLNHSLQKMVTTLQSMMKEIERSMNEVQQQNWIRTGQAELSNSMRGEQELPLLARNIISYLASYLQAKVGTIYLADEENSSLRLVGSYAYVTRKGNRNKFTLGDGLVGQAALEKQPILFTDVPDDYLMISSSLGETVPHSILVAPFMYEGEVKGIVELGTVGNFTEVQRTFLEQVLENIAITFHSAQTRGKMQELLEATQRQAQELQTQQETLRVANEELESQTAALRESERKLQTQQEELRQTNEELAEQTKALERQQRILQDQNLELEKARQLVEEKAKELEISSKYKSEFLANMSHELRTPLNSLLILSKILSENKEGNLTEKQLEFAKTIHAAGSDLLDLINEVLDLSKIEAGKMILHIEAMSLKGLSNYIAQHFSHIAKEKGLKLNMKLAKGLPASIRTDRQRVEQILKNLLSNAIKFTEKGGVTVVIKRPAKDVDLSRSGLSPQRTIVISVSDTGIGIPEQKQRLIFEAFQQADGTTSRRYGGTGLGLSIVREFTKLLGGEIHLHSKEGQGSRFSLYLPETLKDEHQIVPSPEAIRKTNKPLVLAGATTLAEKVLAGNEKQLGIETIWDDRHDPTFPTDKFLLIIEDDPKFAKILFDLTREKGFKGLIAGDGAAGLQLAYQYKPSAIILDVGLPDIDGWTVMKKLKNNPETRHIPVHFISAYDRPLDAMKMGAIGYLTKPVSPDQLNRAFKTIEQSISKTIGKLLIVEDDEATRLSMLELLGGGDVDITTAKTGEEAYTLLKSNAFDCMVLDLGLADISGFELLEKIHSDTAMAQLPIIVYTARDLTKDEEIKLKKHAESIIIKGAKSQERLLDEVTLFLHRVEAELPEAQQKKLKMIHDKEAVLEGKTVLMVDDDMRNVFALASVLEEKGIHVLIGENGREALELLNTHPKIDLVLMDIMMPEMDGYETTREIRKQPKFRNLPVIALTAKAMKGDRQKCIDAGANDYLSKPVDADKLLSLLRVWLY